MTRADIIKQFPNATEEQISALLNAHHSELEAVKDKNKELKDAAKELESAQKELEELRAKSENGAPDDWKAQIDKLTEANKNAQATIRNMELKASLLGQGFGSDDVEEYIKTINEGGDIATVLGKMKDNAISAHEKARLERTPDPKGSGATPPDEKDAAEKLASSFLKDTKSDSQSDILANYK